MGRVQPQTDSRGFHNGRLSRNGPGLSIEVGQELVNGEGWEVSQEEVEKCGIFAISR